MGCNLLYRRERTSEGGRLNKAPLGSRTKVDSVFVHSPLYIFWLHRSCIQSPPAKFLCIVYLRNFPYEVVEKIWQAVEGNFRCSDLWPLAARRFLTCYQTGSAVESSCRVAGDGSCHPNVVLPCQCSHPKWKKLPFSRHFFSRVTFVSFFMISWQWWVKVSAFSYLWVWVYHRLVSHWSGIWNQANWRKHMHSLLYSVSWLIKEMSL